MRPLQISFNPLSPKFLPDADLWACNTFHRVLPKGVKPTGWFQVHKLTKTRESQPEHWEWLKQKHDFPIYMQCGATKSIPSAVRIPIEELNALWTLSGPACYGSSFSYMMAMAIHQGYKQVVVEYVELACLREAYIEAPNFMVWVAIGATGHGMEIKINSRLADVYKYGYEDRMIPAWSPPELRDEMIIRLWPEAVQLQGICRAMAEKYEDKLYGKIGEQDSGAIGR
jgi:hypothetical protein